MLNSKNRGLSDRSPYYEGKIQEGKIQPNVLWQSLLAVLTSLLFAGSFAAGKYITDEMGPLLMYIIASAFLQLLVEWQGDFEPHISKAAHADKLYLSLLSLLIYSAALLRPKI